MGLRGAMIVVEGLDRAGKSSQCTRLVENLQKQGRQVKHMRFPGEQKTSMRSSFYL